MQLYRMDKKSTRHRRVPENVQWAAKVMTPASLVFLCEQG